MGSTHPPILALLYEYYHLSHSHSSICLTMSFDALFALVQFLSLSLSFPLWTYGFYLVRIFPIVVLLSSMPLCHLSDLSFTVFVPGLFFFPGSEFVGTNLVLF